MKGRVVEGPVTGLDEALVAGRGASEVGEAQPGGGGGLGQARAFDLAGDPAAGRRGSASQPAWSRVRAIGRPTSPRPKIVTVGATQPPACGPRVRSISRRMRTVGLLGS